MPAPHSNPDTPPDSRDPAGTCPRCGRSSNFQLLGSLPVSWDTERYVSRVGGGAGMERPEVARVSSLVCMGCKQGTAVVEVIDSESGAIVWKGFHWWPPPSSADFDEAIPEGLRDRYTEAMRALSVKAPRGAAVLLRRVVEGIVKTSGSDEATRKVKGSLRDGLQQMADDGTLDKSLAEWAKEVRLTGNAGGHYDLDEDVSQDEAEDLAKLARQILHYVYALPAQLRRARGRQ